MTIRDKLKRLKLEVDEFARFSDNDLGLLYREFSNRYSNAGTFYHELTAEFVKEFQGWVIEKVPEVEPITYENTMKKLDEYFANVSDKQFEKDLKKAGYGRDNDSEAPMCDAKDCSGNKEGRCGVRPYINVTADGSCLDYEALREEEYEPERFFGENIRNVINAIKKFYRSRD